MSAPTIRIALCIAAVICLCQLLDSGDAIEGQSFQSSEDSTSFVSKKELSLNVLGVTRAGCDQCHYEESEAWMKTAHFSSTNKLLRFRGNTRKYANALGISSRELMTTSMCADCHGTKTISNNRIEVVSGVSCESCHGAAGGDDGWLNRHQSYDSDQAVSRTEETESHLRERQAACDAVGMVRPVNIAGMTRRCLSCHIITNETLVAAGHKAFSNLEFNSWTSGEIRHNFFLDRNQNQEAPTLWLERSGSTATQRQRVKFIVGTMVSLEVVLRKRAELTNPTVIPQLGGFATALNGRLGQINSVSEIPETQAAEKLFTPMLTSIFIPDDDDRQTYTQAADMIAELTNQFLKHNDVGSQNSLDSILSLTPPHYSQTYKDRPNP